MPRHGARDAEKDTERRRDGRLRKSETKRHKEIERQGSEKHRDTKR